MRWLLMLLVVSGCKTETAAVKTEIPTAQVAAPVKEKVSLPEAPALGQVAGLPPMPASKVNPLTPEKAELGRLLFFDKRMSKDGSMACEGCHHIPNGWTSGQPLDVKVGGAMNKRNAPAVTNLGYHSSYYWDGRMPTLEAVSNAAWKGQLGAEPGDIATKLNENPVYRAHFQRAFGEMATSENIPKALASFFRALNTGNSPWDAFVAGDSTALSENAQKGYQVFLRANCAVCHVPPLFSDFDFHNIGWGQGDAGRRDATSKDVDTGKFKTPSLRDVALTAPYFHDGGAATLEEAIDFMAKGGAKNPHLDAKLRPVKLSQVEKAQLKAFLVSLTGRGGQTEPPSLP